MKKLHKLLKNYSRREIALAAAVTFVVVTVVVIFPKRANLNNSLQPSPLPASPAVSTPATSVDSPQQMIANFNNDYDYPLAAQASGSVRIPILAYHHIAELPPVGTAGRDLYVSPAVFDQQMAYLQVKGYRTVTARQYYDLLMTGQNPVQKTVMLTFGDGNDDNYSNAFPILKKYGLVGNFFIISGIRHISDAQLQEMQAAGMAIEGHSMTHVALGGIFDPAYLKREVVQSKQDIEAVTGKPIFAFLYPNCTFNDQAMNLVKATYNMALACGAAIDNAPGDVYNLQRVYMYDDLDNFKQRLSGIMTAVYQ